MSTLCHAFALIAYLVSVRTHINVYAALLQHGLAM